jgi:hypothetical protein
MQPSQQKRQWRAQGQSRPGSSTDHRETQRTLHGSYWRRDNQDNDAWPPRSTSQLQQRHKAISAPTPSWRDRVNRAESLAQGGNRWINSEAEEHSQRSQPPVRRWRSPDPPARRGTSELDTSSVSRSSAQCHQTTYPLRAPQSLNVSRLGGGNALGAFVHERWDAKVDKDPRSTLPQWADDDDDDDYDEEEEDNDEQNNSTLEHRYSASASSYERWQKFRADHPLQRPTGGHGPNHVSHVEDVGVSHSQVPTWAQRRQLSRTAELPARRWPQSDEECSQDSQSEAHQERASQSLTTNPVDFQSFPTRPTRPEMVDRGKAATSMLRRPPHTLEAGQASSFVHTHDERFGNGDEIGSESNVHSTSKRNATLPDDVSIVDRGSEPGEVLVALNQPKVSGCQNTIVKPSRHETRKRYRKRCQYPNGCDKGAIGRTLFCTAHGGGKRCQYPNGCDKGAIGRTLFCTAHGGGKRCQYPDGCDKSAKGSTKFCLAHGGGKRCQYLEGCDSSAQGSTMFCKIHGGGKRCHYPDGCDKSAQGTTMFCAAHGGGKRCQYPEGCDKGAQGRTVLCAAHGGGKRCQFPKGCDKGARGSTMFCTAHGGGKRCQYPEGCDKSAEGSTMFCVAHGGGKRCQYHVGCDKSAQGSTMFCKAHGGGKRCHYPDGCDKSAIGRTLLCTVHGGGKRCQHPEGCEKSAIGRTLFCTAHGGGKRCQYPEGCDKSAQGSTMFCLAHGGGKRCQYPEGCDKSAKGSTLFCIAHGGGKRCQYPDGCDKSAIGRTLFCTAHGGGKRCQYPEGCSKGAEGPTMFCAAHGGGRRCGHESGCHKHVIRGGLCKSHGAEAGD